ncbi:MAG: FxsA family protein [Nocardioidaceae bacterium]
MPWTLLAALLLIVPIVEIYVIIQVGQVIGAVATIVLLIVESALGAWIVKREGRRAWQALSTAFDTGRLPTRELADAALVLVGGTLLLTPGFVTDVAGFFFVLPFTRPLARRGLSWLVARRVAAGSARMFGGQTGRGGGRVPPRSGPHHGGGSRWGGTGHHQDGKVVPGEVVDDD